jgi:hypothetical protein
LDRNLRVFLAARLHDLKPHAFDCRDDLVHAHAFEIVGIEGRGGKRKVKR